LTEALDILTRLVESHPNEKAILLALGYFHWEHGKIGTAISVFQRVVELFPESKLSSLGLFHTMLKAGMYDKALDEAKRFISIRECEEYNQLINDIAIGAELGKETMPEIGDDKE
jgi:predicted Zn-dependent protease